MNDLMLRRREMAQAGEKPQNLPVPYTRRNGKSYNVNGGEGSNVRYGGTTWILTDGPSYYVLCKKKLSTLYFIYQIYNDSTFIRGDKFSWQSATVQYNGETYYKTNPISIDGGGDRFRFCWNPQADGDSILVFRNV